MNPPQVYMCSPSWTLFPPPSPYIGEGNGNPLQCSCLENPRDSAAWWAAVYGVAQSQTRLTRLSSNGILRKRRKLVLAYHLSSWKSQFRKEVLVGTVTRRTDKKETSILQQLVSQPEIVQALQSHRTRTKFWLSHSKEEAQLCGGNLPHPGIKPGSPALQADSLPSESPEKPAVYLYTDGSNYQ